jgi:hypothetical protein
MHPKSEFGTYSVPKRVHSFASGTFMVPTGGYINDSGTKLGPQLGQECPQCGGAFVVKKRRKPTAWRDGFSPKSVPPCTGFAPFGSHYSTNCSSPGSTTSGKEHLKKRARQTIEPTAAPVVGCLPSVIFALARTEAVDHGRPAQKDISW